MEVEHTLRRFVAAGMQTRNAELSWMRVCCVFGVVLYHSIQSMLDVTDWQGTPQLKQKISSSMQFLSGCIVPGLFACIAEVAMVTTEPCTFSSKPANAPLKLRQVMEWYYHVIVSPANWNLLPSFLFTYLLLIKLDVYFNLLGGVGSFTEFYVQNWAVSYAWFPMYLWGMFIVNGFYLGSMGGYGFAAVLAKAAVFVLPYTLALSSGSDSGLVLGSLASFLLPYVCIYLCSKFSPGSLLVCWVNMLVLFGCNCLSSFLLEQASSTPTLLRWITMNHYFLLGMITSTMVECHEQHPTWARGLGLCALLALITTQSYTDPETTGCWHRALSTWTWVFTLRCVSRAIFADYLKNKKTCRAENFLRESWLHIYLLHVPFVHLCKHLFSVPQGEEPWGIVPAASLTLLLSLVASLILCTTYRLILRPAFFRAGVSLGWWPSGRRREEESCPQTSQAQIRRGSTIGTPLAGVASSSSKIAQRSGDPNCSSLLTPPRRGSLEPQRPPPLDGGSVSPAESRSGRRVSFDESADGKSPRYGFGPFSPLLMIFVL